MSDQALLSQLESKDLNERLLAIKRIGMHYDPAMAEHLVKRLKDPNPKIREACVLSLGAIGNE